jgi:hypothetical protein
MFDEMMSERVIRRSCERWNGRVARGFVLRGSIQCVVAGQLRVRLALAQVRVLLAGYPQAGAGLRYEGE